MSEHRVPLAQATASLMQIISLWQEYQSVLILGDVERAEALRVKAHDTLDAYFDRGNEVATSVRAISGQ